MSDFSPVDELREELAELSRDEIVGLLAEANRRGVEAEQFLNYAPTDQIILHRSRVLAAQRSSVFARDLVNIPMPEIRGGKSVWNPPANLLDYDQAMKLPVGSRVQWVGDRREGGLRERTASGWDPCISSSQFYWLLADRP